MPSVTAAHVANCFKLRMRRATTHVEYSFSAKAKTNGKISGNFQRGKSEKIAKIEHLLEIEKFNVQSVARALRSTEMDRSYHPVSTELLLSYRINKSLGNCLGTLMPAASEHLSLVALVVLALFVLLVLFVALCLRSHFLIQLFKLPLAFVLFLS